jgi:purine-cytosine permease-like protein
MGGTVYSGAPAGRTTYVNTGATAVNVGARKGARIFYIIAAVTVLKTLLVYFGLQQLKVSLPQDKLQQILVIDLVVAGIFALIGLFTQNGSKIALVIGMVLYGADMLLMLLNPAPNIVYILVHGLFLYYLFNAYRQFAD